MSVLTALLPDLLKPALIALSCAWMLTLFAYAKRMSEGNVVVFFVSLFLMLALSFATCISVLIAFVLISSMF